MAEPSERQNLLLRVPVALHEKAEQAAQEHGVSLNLFITSAVLEWIERSEQTKTGEHTGAGQ